VLAWSDPDPRPSLWKRGRYSGPGGANRFIDVEADPAADGFSAEIELGDRFVLRIAPTSFDSTLILTKIIC